MKDQFPKIFSFHSRYAQPLTVMLAFSLSQFLIGCLAVSDPWIFQGEGYVYPAKKDHPSDLQENEEKEQIEGSIQKNWMSVYEDGMFKPNNPVSREAFLYVLYQAVAKELADLPENQGSQKLKPQPGSIDSSAAPYLSDIDKDRWSRAAIEKLAHFDLLEAKKAIDPTQNITRLEAIGLLAKTVELRLESKAVQAKERPWLFLDLVEQNNKAQPEPISELAVSIGKLKAVCPSVSLGLGHPATLQPDAILTRSQLAQLAMRTSACLEDPMALLQNTARLKTPEKNDKSSSEIKNAGQAFETACDVVVNGGSLAGIAAALAASQNGAVTCLIEPLGYAAGYWVSGAEPQSTLFFNAEANIFEGKPHYLTWFDKETAYPCKKDTQCMIPELVLKKKLGPLLQKSANLFVLYQTQVKNLERKEKLIRSIQVTRATPVQGAPQKAETIVIRSASTASSPLFIETSPLGSLFVHSGDAWLQGLENLNDKGLGSDLCGTAFGFPLLIPTKNLTENVGPELASRVSVFNGKSWTGADLKAIPLKNTFTVEFTPKDQKQAQAFRYIYLEKANVFGKEHYLLSREETIAQIPAWKGGLNMKAFQKAKEHASNWLAFFEEMTKEKVRLASGYFPGGHAVPEWPRMSDGRRSIGIGNYLMGMPEDKSETVFEARPSEEFFGLQTCSYPKSTPTKETLPQSIAVTLGALTNRDALNLLAAGPTLAANFASAHLASSSEAQWKSGVFAGAAAAMLYANNKKTTELATQTEKLRELARTTWGKLGN